ncbi:hypothetical protein M2404_002175 [Rheinheimera pacifica]|uniref:hypothetical protein n=1 Tax=Rheinheimera pacifica TaxID=173990 RepID=UPI0021673679|nr:hypothetical protein [Rheinheimera pacifica]MCS4307827.1 hypothetical protein [Rheinheimera pacifica]
MQFTEWKSFRLILFPWFMLHLYVYVKYSFFVDTPDALQFVRSSITTLMLIGCVFYSAGLKCLTRTVWQILFAIAVFDELFGFYEDGIEIVSFMILSTYYLVLGLYAFQNKTIWRQSRTDET